MIGECHDAQVNKVFFHSRAWDGYGTARGKKINRFVVVFFFQALPHRTQQIVLIHIGFRIHAQKGNHIHILGIHAHFNHLHIAHTHTRARLLKKRFLLACLVLTTMLPGRTGPNGFLFFPPFSEMTVLVTFDARILKEYYARLIPIKTNRNRYIMLRTPHLFGLIDKFPRESIGKAGNVKRLKHSLRYGPHPFEANARYEWTKQGRSRYAIKLRTHYRNPPAVLAI